MEYGDSSAEGEVRGRIFGMVGSGDSRVVSGLGGEFGGLWHGSKFGLGNLEGSWFRVAFEEEHEGGGV